MTKIILKHFFLVSMQLWSRYLALTLTNLTLPYRTLGVNPSLVPASALICVSQMLVERKVSNSQSKKITSLKGLASLAKMMSLRGQSSSTGVPPNQKSEQS
jgi:hypothetical protein